MRLFLDTEFTDFTNPEMISIGIVDENGREFYAESTQFRREACSQFVVDTVLPLLGQQHTSIVGNTQHIAYLLAFWLEEYQNTGVTICVDYATDWHLFLDLMSSLGDDHRDRMRIDVELIWTDLDQQRISDWWAETKLPQHHALYDARANRHGYDEKNKYEPTPEPLTSDLPLEEQSLVYRLRKRAEIRRQIPTRKSVQDGEPDRLADLLDEAAAEIERLTTLNQRQHNR